MMLLDHPGMVVSSHQRPLNRHNPWSSKQVACALLLHMAAGMLHLCKNSIQHVLACWQKALGSVSAEPQTVDKTPNHLPAGSDAWQAGSQPGR